MLVHRFAVRALLAPLAVVAMLAGLFAAVASPVQATTNDGTLPGQHAWTKVLDKHEYMLANVYRGMQVLKIDTEHADADGFWIAYKETPWASGVRPMKWAYQEYGKWCGHAVNKMEWNPWMGMNWCTLNPDYKASPDDPDGDFYESGVAYLRPHTAICRAETGYPWKRGAPQSERLCDDHYLNWITQPSIQMPVDIFDCAPWEDQAIGGNGRAKCLSKTYPWMNDQVNTFWVPAPDTCTGMPADSSRGLTPRDPALYAPQTGGDGTCTGAALPPNCNAANVPAGVRACSGAVTEPDPVEPGPDPVETFTGNATVTETVTDTFKIGATVTVAHSGVVATVKQTVSRKHLRHRHKATARTKITRSVSSTKTVVNNIVGTGTATRSASCVKPTQVAANECATLKATDLARDAARATARGNATVADNGRTADEASAAARAAAAVAHAKLKPTKAQKKVANAQAKQKALKKVRKKIAAH